MGIVRREAQLRDIRADLKDRLRKAAANADRHRKEAEGYDQEVATLTSLIDREEKRFGSSTEGHSERNLSDFILESLATGSMSKDGIRSFAHSKGVEADGRSLHATIINLLRAGKIKETNNAGFYDLT